MQGGVPSADVGRPSGVSETAADLSAAADHPSAYIPGDRRRALASGATLATQIEGAALFADISGFTPLAEALAEELGSHHASEVLASHLNRVFHAVIAELDRFGGEVIYFSGDAITCWLDGDDGLRATASGVAMQAAMAREGEVSTPAGITLQLGLKVAVATGAARRFLVGDPEIQLIDVLAGALIDRLAAIEQVAERGEVVADSGTLAALGHRAVLGVRRRLADGGEVAVVERLVGAVGEASPAADDLDAVPEALARQWLLRAVYERLSSGRGEFLPELRPAYPVFVSFGGIDYDHDDDAGAKLDTFVRAAQRTLSDFGGNVLQLTLGDKGAYLYGVFGTPHAHEDDAERACAAALALHALAATTAARDIRIGITYGRLRSGTYGHARRRTFVCLGDAVNLAARLMAKAPASQTYVSELVRARTGDRFNWRELEPLALKGKAAPVVAASLLGSARPGSRRGRSDRPALVGRATELNTLLAALDRAVGGRGKIVGISAEAGMGKSRLIAEFTDRVQPSRIRVAFGECQAFGTSTSYLAWRELWRTLLRVPEDAAVPEQVAVVERALAALDESLAQRAPLLDVVLGLPIPDNELTRSFDPKLRKASLESLLAACVRGLAASEPLVLVLEDCHWLDPLSRDLLAVIARTVLASPALLVLAYRPDAASPQGLGLGRLPGLEELALDALDDSEVALIVREKLSRLRGEAGSDDGGGLSQFLLELVAHRAQGNPFYAEELLNFVHSRGIDPSDTRALHALELPDSLHSLILGRIDALDESPRRTLKVASVIGRAFRAPMLPEVYRDLGSLDDVRSQLQTLHVADLVVPDREADDAHAFKHVVTQEATYASLPYALRATLHRQVGAFLERGDTEAVGRNLDLLAHHYWHSNDEERKRHYLGRAAEAARGAYANAAAIDYYERLAPLLEGGDRVDALLELGGVLELVGEWDRARATEENALALASAGGDARAQARCEAALAEVARKQGLYDEATERLARAAATFAELGDDTGLGRVAHLEGTLAAQRGDYEQACSRYEESLAIRERLGDRAMMASVLSNLGIVAEYEGRYERARALHEQALALRAELEDRWAISVSETNLGMIALLEQHPESARTHFEEAMRLSREVGDAWMVAVTDNNLGNANRDLGDRSAAAAHYRASLETYRDYADSWAMAFLLEDVGRFGALAGDPETALKLLGAADTMREEIGAPRAANLENEIGQAIAAATATLSSPQQERARADGRALGFNAAVDVALALVWGIEATS